jgi:dTMP kinase
MFVVLEGLDGCGKSTLAKLLGGWLKERGRSVLLTSEPTDGRIGGLIREVLSGGKKVDASALALLFTADRMQHLAGEVEPALSSGKVVVCERYYYSTVAYQSAQGVDSKWLTALNSAARRPDLGILIDVDPAVAASRTSTGEIFENKEFLSKVRENYLMFDDLVRVDGGGSLDSVFSKVKGVVLEHAAHF